MERIIEILQYTLRKGTGVTFHNIMREISIPLHQRHGIEVISFGHSMHNPDCYYLIRAFDSHGNMVVVLDAFYASTDWRSGPREDIISCIESSQKTVVSMPSGSMEELDRYVAMVNAQ